LGYSGGVVENNKPSSGFKNTDSGNQIQAPAISLPKGGGAIKGIDEKFTVNGATGTGSQSIPIFTSPEEFGGHHTQLFLFRARLFRVPGTSMISKVKGKAEIFHHLQEVFPWLF
jgi:hypothetical protein